MLFRLMLLCWFTTTTIFITLVNVGTCKPHNFSSIFIFGDSLVDVGNNNYITTLSKANYKPIGIDFGKPTGRFTNGRTVVDIIGKSLGFKTFPPPYLAPSTRGPVVLKGVNYASGSSGILDESGANYIGRIPMDAQLKNFAKTRQEIISSIGIPSSVKLFATALFTVTTGSNDFINNYLQPGLTSLLPPETFIRTMISTFTRQLTVNSVKPLGCQHFIIYDTK
ncbi:GDSL esterase/lipase At4g16230-like [Bidens hawaiensis]|uniref:GDSL esterase/lipase At4g16230-like n=1 Tax=Bidens hawaiensis TaxID=980011 RepID=UPI004049E9F1